MVRSSQEDTIVAIASPSGEGAIALIRLSGKDAFPIADKVFSKSLHSFPSHTAHYGKILDQHHQTIDHVLLLLMRAPHSYTGENTIEISCHGGSFVTEKIVEILCKAGARLAEPGEFSLRAFLNGKIDLAQAEAVQQLIASRSALALQNAGQQLEGSLSKKILSFQKELVEIAAILEAVVDFPEEGLEFVTNLQILQRTETLAGKMEKLRDSFHDGRLLHEGILLCLVGTPNVGKSSVMNALLKRERAIVTEIAGTTRDLLEEEMRWGRFHFRLLDTAGIRETEELIEKEGIRRSRKAMQEADLVLLLLDASRPLSHEDHNLLKILPPTKTLVVWNKIDLAPPDPSLSSLGISAKEGIGFESLQKAIEDFLLSKDALAKEEVMITRLRHKEALAEAHLSLQAAIAGLQKQISPEFLASDIRASLHSLGTILGMNITEEILNSIFSKFCLGK